LVLEVLFDLLQAILHGGALVPCSDSCHLKDGLGRFDRNVESYCHYSAFLNVAGSSHSLPYLSDARSVHIRRPLDDEIHLDMAHVATLILAQS